MKLGEWSFMFVFLIGGCLWMVGRLMVGVIRKNRDDTRVAVALEEIAHMELTIENLKRLKACEEAVK